MDSVRALLEAQPLFTLFLTIALGYLVGEVNIKGFSLGLALDVYEQEADLFFRDLSSEVIGDDTFQRLLSFPNVIVTGHQAFFTEDAIRTICETTIGSITQFEKGLALTESVPPA
jgi:lactate dehydrogenase-like 2-hydroxyacid dehydrogenase